MPLVGPMGHGGPRTSAMARAVSLTARSRAASASAASRSLSTASSAGLPCITHPPAAFPLGLGQSGLFIIPSVSHLQSSAACLAAAWMRRSVMMCTASCCPASTAVSRALCPSRSVSVTSTLHKVERIPQVGLPHNLLMIHQCSYPRPMAL